MGLNVGASIGDRERRLAVHRVRTECPTCVALAIPLPEELLLQGAHPAQVHVLRLGQVTQVCHLEHHLHAAQGWLRCASTQAHRGGRKTLGQHFTRVPADYQMHRVPITLET